VGFRHPTANHHRPARLRRPRPRCCLRKGCGRLYTPRRWNQRYCQDPQCLREVRRWQAAKRQARRRLGAAAKDQHAAAERARRERRSSSPHPLDTPEVASARGHAAEFFSPQPMCDRPGCYEPPPKVGRNQARYCGPDCRQAVRRVIDRERKWRQRGTLQGRRARAREYQAARARLSGQQHDAAGGMPPGPPRLGSADQIVPVGSRWTCMTNPPNLGPSAHCAYASGLRRDACRAFRVLQPESQA
jgi:hypothetical protein